MSFGCNRTRPNGPLSALRRAMVYVGMGLAVSTFATATAVAAGRFLPPPPPPPEPITVSELPLPPTAPSTSVGACTTAINPNGTGCISADSGAIQSGSFLPGNHEILSMVTYAGAPAAPDPASIYSGTQIILIKTDGTSFSNGDAWKCLTCGVPAANQAGVTDIAEYPQSFQDGMHALAGTTILDCTPYNLADDQCTASQLHMYPIRWNVTADGSGDGGSIRELRIHPDNVHLGFNSIQYVNGALNEYPFFGRLVFNPSPTTGDPMVPRYDLINVTTLLPSNAYNQEVVTQVPNNPQQLMINHNAIDTGEFRGFSKDGTEAFYIGYPWESDNIDVFAVNLTTGAVRRMTNNPGYVDPVDASPDDQWVAMMETDPSTRMQFMSAMRGTPPINDMVTTGAVASVRNNGNRRFFEPILLDRYAERGNYQGQQINAGNQSPGGIDDPNWNGQADPRWSWDGTMIAYWQALVVSPACGGTNPLPCPVSTEPGGRATRIMLAKLTSRQPYNYVPPAPVSDAVPWGTPYVAGGALPTRFALPSGTYTLLSPRGGSATVQITNTAGQVSQVSVSYNNFIDWGIDWQGMPFNFALLNGQESVAGSSPNPVTTQVLWNSSIQQQALTIGTPQPLQNNSKLTSTNGFDLTINLLTNLFDATGTLDSTVNGVLYTQPGNGD
jgi:hypothetical protein